MESPLALITGANTGIGYETARSLALQGYRVIIAGRSEGRVQWAADYISEMCLDSGTDGMAFPMILDLSSFDSILRFAVEFGLQYDKLDILICNAGIMNARYSQTENGFESHFQINYLGHYLLTRLMLPYLRESSNPRLINVTSMLGEKARSTTIEDINEIAQIGPEDYSAMTSYRESKFAQMLITRQLNKRYRDFLFTAAVHPGVVNSDLFYRRMPSSFKTLLKPIAWMGYVTGTLKTPYKGADTTIWLSAEEEPLPSGNYWIDRKQKKWFDHALNDQLAADLWDWSNEQVREFLG